MAKKEKKKSGFWSDFRKFIMRGNVLDLAVAVVVGGAFNKIVSGLVTYIINPFIGIFMKEGSLDTIKTVISPAVLAEDGVTVVTPEVAILWGTWLQTILDFVIIAFVIFVIIRSVTKAEQALHARQLAEKAEADKAAAEKANVTPDMSVSDICDAMKVAMTEITYDGLTGTGMTWSADGEPSKAPKAVVIDIAEDGTGSYKAM